MARCKRGTQINATSDGKTCKSECYMLCVYAEFHISHSVGPVMGHTDTETILVTSVKSS